MKILIIEDNADDVDLFKRALNSCDLGGRRLIIESCITMQEANKLIAIFNPEIIILDLNLPDSPLSLTIHKIFELSRGSSVIVATSGTGEEEQLIKSTMANGADSFIHKNTIIHDVKELKKVILCAYHRRISKNFIQQRRLIDELEQMVKMYQEKPKHD